MNRREFLKAIIAAGGVAPLVRSETPEERYRRLELAIIEGWQRGFAKSEAIRMGRITLSANVAPLS